MNTRSAQRTIIAAGLLALLCLPGVAAVEGRQEPDTFNPLDAKYKPAIEAFDERVKAYVKLREDIEDKMPKLSKESTPEEIQKHETEFKARVAAARAGAKQGDVLQPDISEYIRGTIRNEFKGKERQELKKTVLTADNKGVPLKINYPYPETKEFVEMPPTLLLKLPLLPEQVKYRFVGRNMLLVDRENDLIVDYMLDALP